MTEQPKHTTCDKCDTDVAYTCAAELWCQNCGMLEPQPCDCNQCEVERLQADEG
jgi:hypothetical protein